MTAKPTSNERVEGTDREAKRRGQRRPGRPSGRTRGQGRTELLEAARSLVSERGLGSLTMKDVAARANVNSALAHYYFDNREGLEKAVIDHLIDQMAPVREIHVDASDPPSEQLRMIVRSYVKRLLGDPSAAKFALEHLLLAPSERTQDFVEGYIKPGADYMERVVQRAVEQGAIKDSRFLFTLISMVGATLFYSIFVPAAGKHFGIKKDTKRLQEEFAVFLSDLVVDGSASLADRNG